MLHQQSFKGCRVLIIGLGMSGLSAARFLLKRGALVTGVDGKQELLDCDPQIERLRERGLVALHENQLSDVSHFDLLVASPGISMANIFYQQAKACGIEIIGEIELAAREVSTKSVGITGTNGKTTVVLLITHVLQAAGIKAHALGNVGVPLTSAVDDFPEADLFVIELSSFQLETAHTRFLDAAAILNITPDHLDRYASMNEYALAKIHIKSLLKPMAKLFIEERCAKEFQGLFGDCPFLTYGYELKSDISSDTASLFLNGKAHCSLPEDYVGRRSHHLENLLAAFAICREMGILTEQFFSALKTFRKPSHRIEFVRTFAGVHYYDDSKGTNIDAVVRAIDSFDANIVLIAGGVDKGWPYNPWIKAFNGKVKKICAIGQSSEKMKSELGQQLQVESFPSLDHAVTHAAGIAKEGDIVLLSPGCSSYDMFRDYAHRGNEFQRIVNAL